jgi:hypothetical protein
MKYVLFSCLILWLCDGCKKNGPPDGSSLVAFIHFEDSTGADLFVGGSNGYYIDSIRLYYMLNGVKTMVNTDQPGFVSAAPYGVEPTGSQFGDSSILGIQTNFNILNDSSTIFIDLKPGKEDTLTCFFTEWDRILTLAWYDGVPVITAADKDNNFFTVMER